MNKVFCVFLIMLVVFLVPGCGRTKKPVLVGQRLGRQAETESPEAIELAEAVLRPESYQFSLPVDPFKPLTGLSSLLEPQSIESLEVADADINLLGTILMEADAIALLGIPEGVVLVRQGDKVGRYTVKSIELDRIVIEREGKSRILESGGEK